MVWESSSVRVCGVRVSMGRMLHVAHRDSQVLDLTVFL